MAERGLVWSRQTEGEWEFRLAPLIVGIYEAQPIDLELAEMVEDYMAHGGPPKESCTLNLPSIG
jgi:hypothetical protein